jgi:hypothetical protein
MADPITANYGQEDDDWTITVAGNGKTLTGRAPGIIAARDNVDQLVDSLGADAKGATVVHLLNGSALEFTAAYMTARLTRPEAAPLEVPASGSADTDSAAEASDAEDADDADADAEASSDPAVPTQQSEENAADAKPKNKASRRPKAKLTADIGDALEESSPKEPKVSVAATKVTVPSARR